MILLARPTCGSQVICVVKRFGESRIRQERPKAWSPETKFHVWLHGQAAESLSLSAAKATPGLRQRLLSWPGSVCL